MPAVCGPVRRSPSRANPIPTEITASMPRPITNVVLNPPRFTARARNAAPVTKHAAMTKLGQNLVNPSDCRMNAPPMLNANEPTMIVAIPTSLRRPSLGGEEAQRISVDT